MIAIIHVCSTNSTEFSLISTYKICMYFFFNTLLALIQHNVPGLSLKCNNYTKNLFIRFTTPLHAKFLKALIQ